MAKVRVPLHGKPQGYATVDTAATEGAIVGQNLRWPDGSPVTEAQLRAAATPPAQGEFPITYWRLIQEIPPNVVALANRGTTGLYVITAPGASATRGIEVIDGELTVADGDGVEGNPLLGLADVADAGGGVLQRTQFDDKGRKVGTSAATTDDLDEGASNLYHTDERAQDAVGAIIDGTGDVGLTYDTSPARRLWARLSTAIADLINSALQPGDNVSELANDAGYVDAAGAGVAAPVQSVNGETGAVELSAGDVGAATSAQGDLADSAIQPGDPVSTLDNDAGYLTTAVRTIVAGTNVTVDDSDPENPVVNAVGGGGAVDSVNGQAGVVVLDAGDVGADPAGSAASALSAAQTYADGKVIDSIADGDTTRAPSRNAVFDALAGREPSIAAGTIGQFYRGDKVWANSLNGYMLINQDSAPSGQPGFEVTADASLGASEHANVTATTYGFNGGGTFHGRYARGTRATPSPVLSGDIYAGIGGRPYHSGSDFYHSSPVSVHWVAKENQSLAGAGGCLRVLTTKVGNPQSQRKVRAVFADDGDLIVGEYDGGPLPALAGRGIQIIREGLPAEMGQYSFGAGAFAAGVRLVVARGTGASPSATLSGDGAFIGMGGFDGSVLPAASSAGIYMQAFNNWTPTNRATTLSLATTQNGTTNRVDRWTVGHTGTFFPSADNTYDLGWASGRVREFFGANGTINTSDAREKTRPRDLTPEEIACALDIARLPSVFQWLDSVRDKGDDVARLHVSPTVQDVIACMEQHGLDPFRYSFICHDEWPEREIPAETERVLVKPATYKVTPPVYEEFEIADPDGGEPMRARRMVEAEKSEIETDAVYEDFVISPARVEPAGDRYSLRPSGLEAFCRRALAADRDALEARLAAVETAISDAIRAS